MSESRDVLTFKVEPPTTAGSMLTERFAWLIRLRWFAVAGVVLATILSGRVFHVVADARPVYLLATVLLISNLIYAAIERTRERRQRGSLLFAVIQMEADLLILTALLHFSGGPVNPFMSFYAFHVIIATILLPLHLSLLVSISVVLLYGLLIALHLAVWPHTLTLSIGGDPWQAPLYDVGAFAAFAAAMFLTQYLTRTIIIRMARKEREAARHRDLLEAIIDAMAEGMFFVTTDERVAPCNPAARLWLESPGKTDHPLRLDDFPAALRDPLRGQLTSTPPKNRGRQIAFETRTDPPRYIETRTREVTGDNNRVLGVVVVGQDLTDRRRLEESLRRQSEETAAINEFLKTSQVEMAHREKMAAIGQMASGIAHEIGNPLASLSSVVQYLRRKMPGNEHIGHLDTIELQVNRISLILKRMLTLSRPAPREYKWSDVNAMVENVLSLVQYDRRANNVDISLSLDDHLPTVWVNPVHFEQILLNLTVNALDAIAARQTDERQQIEVRTSRRDGMIELQIRDTGIGMDPETCRRAFESFFTTKELGKGTGLGLFITRNLLAEIDGTIHLESQPGAGTTAVVRIPLQPKKNLICGEPSNEDQTITR